MRPFWHPLSALYLAEPLAYASSGLLRMLIRSGEAVELLYGGDRMGRADDQPRPVRVERCDAAALLHGEVVVAAVDGIPDLLRVVGGGGDEGILLQGDADVGDPTEVSATEVFGRVRTNRRGAGRWERCLRRGAIDFREAWHGKASPSRGQDPARSVLEKYDAQAPFYVAPDNPELDGKLLDRILGGVKASGRILVVGCGSGRESFALARQGYRVRGIDFSPAMIESARSGAAERGLDVDFVEADVRVHEEEPASIGGVLFTYDVFSFLPEPETRVELLRRMGVWIEPDGVVLLSARIARRAYECLVLTFQWLRGGGWLGAAWGDSHTRYLSPDGRLRRSYVHYFTPRQLRREAERAGWQLDYWTGGHVELRRGRVQSPPQSDHTPAVP